VSYAGRSAGALPTSLRFRFFGMVFRLVGRLVSRTDTESLPDLGPEPVVFVANHTSMSDVFYAISVLADWRYPARCLVRYSYFTNPLMGGFLRAVGCVPAGGGGTDAVSGAVEILAEGWPVAVMVEGRIVPPDQRGADGMGEFRDGFVTIARTADVRILPIVITNADQVWGSRDRLPRFRPFARPRVDVRVGTPLRTDGLDDADVMAEARGQMAAMLARS